MIEYSNILKSNTQDQYSQVFTEAVKEINQTCHVNPLAAAEDLYGDSTAFNRYVEKLTEGFNATDAENLTKILNNNRMQVLQESSLGGIPPITALNAPTIVKMWAKSGLRNVIPTQVVDKPCFSVITNYPYMLDSKGKKVYLPEGLEDTETKEVGNKEKAVVTISTEEMGKKVDLTKKLPRLAAEEVDTAYIVKVGEKTMRKPMSLERKWFIELEDNNILATIDLEGRTMLIAQTKSAPEAIEVELGVASANHTRSTEISFEIKKRDFEIPTGEHFEANLPLEFINDMYALYRIDAASTVTETMSNVINQKLEQDLDLFVDNALAEREATFKKTFNVHPSPNFAIQHKEWVENLKRVIDYLANLMKNKSYFYQGYFVIYGNPVDVALLPNVSWTFNSASDNVNGINANYSIGAMSGSNKYVIVSSDLVKMGKLKMIMVPTVEDYKTFMYYPYTFNIVNNYLNAQGKKTMPNLMMTKRYITGQFMNLSAEITIEGNDGVMSYQ